MGSNSLHTILAVAVVAPALVGLCSQVWFGMALIAFRNTVTEIRDDRDMQRYKDLAAGQMYAALVQIVLLIAPIAVFIVGIMLKGFTVQDIGYVIIPSVCIFAAGMYVKQIETKVQQTPAATRELEEERDRVTECWMKKPFPDW